MTNKDYLSQEEIDALLNQSKTDPFDDEDDSHPNTGLIDIDQYLTVLEQDALGEIGNITYGNAATALSSLLGKKVDITTPKVSVVFREQLNEQFPQPHVAVHVKYVEGFQGINMLVIRSEDAQVIADLMLGGDGTGVHAEMNEIHISAVQEAMNQMMGSSATSMSTMFNRFINISPPGIDILDFQTGTGTNTLPPEDVFVKVSFRLKIDTLIDSNIMQLLPVPFAKDMVRSLLGDTGSEQSAASASPAMPLDDHQLESAIQGLSPTQQPFTAPVQPPLQPASQEPVATAPTQTPHIPAEVASQPPVHPPQQHIGAAQHAYRGMPDRGIQVQPVQYSNFEQIPAVIQTDNTNLNLLLDIPLRVTVELGRTKKLIKDILDFSQGSIIELDKLAGEPVDILVNNKLIAKGEVVVIDENFGVRVTDIISQLDRIQKLQ